MTATITAQDGTFDTTTPVLIDGWAPSVESANVVHQMIEPGTIAVTLGGDLPRTGSLALVYDNDADAEAARLLLGRPCAFTLVEGDRPVVDMSFVRAGSMSPAMHDQVRSVWTFDVGFQEVTP